MKTSEAAMPHLTWPSLSSFHPGGYSFIPIVIIPHQLRSYR